jgi:predicted RNase H-like HicB family nuclease
MPGGANYGRSVAAAGAGRIPEADGGCHTRHLDPEASVWVAESDDVPGLVTEADDIEALVATLKVLIPELLDASGVALAEQDEVAFVLTASRHERAERHAA